MNALETRTNTNTPAPAPKLNLSEVLSTGRPETAKALVAAIIRSHGVEKAARNQHHQYNYASADAIIEVAREALAQCNLALIPLESSLVGFEREGPDRFELSRTFLLVHTSGEVTPLRVAWPVIPQAGRPLDKACAAADTLSLAYLLRDLLQLPRVEQGTDVAGREDRSAREEHPALSSAKKPKPPPADADELAARLERTEKVLVAKGRSTPGDLRQYIRAQADILDFPEDMACWNAQEVKAAADWVKTFLAAHPAPERAEEAKKPAPAPAVVSRPTVSMEQLASLTALLKRKGRSWEFARMNMKHPAGMRPADLTPAQHAELMKLLDEEPDATARTS